MQAPQPSPRRHWDPAPASDPTDTGGASASPSQTPLGGLKLFTASHQDQPLGSSCPCFLKAVILPDYPENKKSRLGAGIPSDVPELPPLGTSRRPLQLRACGEGRVHVGAGAAFRASKPHFGIWTGLPCGWASGAFLSLPPLCLHHPWALWAPAGAVPL